MSALLEWQRLMRAQLLGARCDDERLSIHRHTGIATLIKALRLSYPATRLLVGDEFFEGVANCFIAEHAPRSACLDQYGEPFGQFLSRFPAAAAISYLPDVARLEWAVSRAAHAPDTTSPDRAQPMAARLTTLISAAGFAMEGLRFRARPDVSVVCVDAPADDIWRAVLSHDDAAMNAVELAGGPFHLLIERRGEAIAVDRLDPVAGRFAAALLSAQPLETALGSEAAAGNAGDFSALLAAHLRAGRFVDFSAAGEHS